MALVVFLPRPEILHTFWVPRNKKSQIPEEALVDLGPDGLPCLFATIAHANGILFQTFQPIPQRVQQ